MCSSCCRNASQTPVLAHSSTETADGKLCVGVLEYKIWPLPVVYQHGVCMVELFQEDDCLFLCLAVVSRRLCVSSMLSMKKVVPSRQYTSLVSAYFDMHNTPFINEAVDL
jgi:hypothetical protein